MACTCPRQELHTRYEECTLEQIPWPVRTHAHYLAEVRNQLHRVDIGTEELRNQLVLAMRHKQKFPWGRCVFGRNGIPFGLRAGDKLVLGGSLLTHINALEDLPLPFHVFFIRITRTTGIAGISVLWNIPGVHNLGIDHFMIDHFGDCVLHTVDLGLGPRLIGVSFMYALRKNVYGLEGSMHEKLTKGMLSIKADTKLYYKKVDKENKDSGKCSRVKSLSLKKLGILDRPCLKAKGAQSRNLVRFTKEFLRKHARKQVRQHVQ